MSTYKANKSYFIKLIIISLLLLIFTIIYEQFSHDVVSIHMRGLFLLPILSGIISYAFMKNNYDKVLISITNMALVSIGLYLLLYGIFEIYGTMPYFVVYYLYLGGIILLIDLLYFIIRR